MDKDRVINVLDEIAEDMKRDAADFDGKPFTGKTMGTYMGYHGAAIATLAKIIKELLIKKEGTNG
jgi:hypothetical protein